MLNSIGFSRYYFLAFVAVELGYFTILSFQYSARLPVGIPVRFRTIRRMSHQDESWQIKPNLLNLMVDLWRAASDPEKETPGKEFRLIDYNLSRGALTGFLKHFQFCKDCSLDNCFLMTTQTKDKEDALYLSYVSFPLLTDDEAEDSAWGRFDPKLLKEEDLRLAEDHKTNKDIFPIENDNQVILCDTKHWVDKVIAQFAVCPFTMDANRAGIPLGGVRYRVSHAVTSEEAFLSFWEEVQLLLTTKEKDISTTLLIFPEIELFGNYELFEFYCECLNDALSKSSLDLEEEIQLVFFHPKYNFRDGKDRIMAEAVSSSSTREEDSLKDDLHCLNYARRSPWPMINLLRSNQVKAAQKGIPTGLVYQRNEERLQKVGARQLQTMLEQRSWIDMPIVTEGMIKPPHLEEKRVIDLHNPLLTSFDPAEKRCTFQILLESPVVDDESLASSEDTSRENSPHYSSQDSNSNASKKSVEDYYLRLAEEVEQWLQSEE